MRRLLFASLFCGSCAMAFDVPHVSSPPTIDGNPEDRQWQQADWQSLDHLMLGTAPDAADFSGRYKLVWTNDYLYLLAEITDDILIDTHADPLDLYWEDDTLEIFVDEDASGGLHLNDFNAFAYHIALDNQVVDFAPVNGAVKPRLFPGHVLAEWKRAADAPNRVYWEARIAIHNDTHSYGDDTSSRIRLEAGKTLGFMVAYCDADGADGRQHFMGDIEIDPVDGDRNRGYIDADVFGELLLVDKKKNNQ